MRVFADLHHAALYYSLQLLFEKRFGAEMYRPIGTEWYPDYWMVHNHPATVQQYLGLDQAIKVPTDVRGDPLPESARLNANYRFEDGIYYVNDPAFDHVNRAITLEKFKETKFDIMIASMPQHIGPFIELQKKYQPQAKLIFQAGNAWQPDGRIKNFMGSIASVPVPAGINAVFYHQEFSLDNFRYEPPKNQNTVRSFVHYMSGKPQMNKLAALMPGWDFRSFGAGMEDSVCKMSDMGERMREAAFIFHDKAGADGFGHSWHSAFAVGRPVICKGSQYKDKLGGALMEHNRTCIDVERLGSMEAVVQRLKEVVSTDEHTKMCEAAHQRFKQVVDYDREEQEIRKFIERLV